MIRPLMTSILVASAIGCASMSLAEADGPDFLRVVDVASDDVLNIRADASASAQKIGEIPHDADGIQNLGCSGGLSYAEWQNATEDERAAGKKRRWCQIAYNGVEGWAAGRFLAEGSAPVGDTDDPGFVWRLVAVGDTAALGEGQIVFSPDGVVSGSTGCNRFNTTAVAKPGGLSFPEAMPLTRMACPGDIADQENTVVSVLSGDVRISYDPLLDQMTLEPDQGGPSLRFQQVR